MKKTPMLAAIAALALGGAAPDPVAWKMAETPAKPVKAGARFTVKLAADIQPGWHIYSLKPMSEGPIPTRVWLAEGQPFALAAAVVAATEPETMQDASFGMEVELYEGKALFTLPVRAAAGAAAGGHNLVVSASYQSCNNKICLPPKTVKVEAAVTVAK
jgi:DsbC/DsbD-like thiol-disulfide interchange protein